MSSRLFEKFSHRKVLKSININAGYGKPYPTKSSTKIYTIVLICVGVYVIMSIFHSFVSKHISRVKKFVIRGLRKRQPSEKNTRALLSEELKAKAMSVVSSFRMNCSNSFVNWLLMFRAIIAIMLCIAVCTVYFMFTEDWNFVDALYFAVQTSTVWSLFFPQSLVCNPNLNLPAFTDGWIRRCLSR